MNNRTKTNYAVNCLGVILGLILVGLHAYLAGGFLLGMGLMGLLQMAADAKGFSRHGFKKNQDAVSPVIGVILMVAITVILAAIVFVLVSQVTSNTATQTPSLVMMDDGRGNYTVQSVSHEVAWSDVLLTGGCMPVGAIEEFIHAADEIRCNAGVKLTVVHRPSDSIMYRDS